MLVRRGRTVAGRRTAVAPVVALLAASVLAGCTAPSDAGGSERADAPAATGSPAAEEKPVSQARISVNVPRGKAVPVSTLVELKG